MLELVAFVLIIALLAFVVSLMLGQQAGIIAFVVLLLLVLLTASPGLHIH